MTALLCVGAGVSLYNACIRRRISQGDVFLNIFSAHVCVVLLYVQQYDANLVEYTGI